MQPKVSFPLFALFGATRAIGGIGLGLLLADRIPHDRRKLIGKIMFGFGAVSTIPLIASVIRQKRHLESAGVMTPNTQIYTPEQGTVDDAELIDNPQHPETVIIEERF